MTNTSRINRFFTDEERLQKIEKDGVLITTELKNIDTIFQKEDYWPDEKLDEYLSTTQHLIDLFVNGFSHKDRAFLQTIEEYHYAISKKEELKKFDMYTVEIDRARHLMAELYLKGIFNPVYDISVNPMRCSIDELLEICRFIEKDYWDNQEGKINRFKYHKDYFTKKEKMYLPQLLREKYLGEKIPEEQIPLFLAIFDEKNGYSMEVFDDILINILGYSDKEFINLIDQYNLLEV